ncbi:hypothetical protein C8Q73DRAFT_503596 [Cubamyces lactineus]|nr:hypothetical protein C8Q73DRAFT_503596 [Cubamyces lactineus]
MTLPRQPVVRLARICLLILIGSAWTLPDVIGVIIQLPGNACTLSSFSWAYSIQGLSPCQVITTLLRSCADIDANMADYPNNSPCYCNTVAYSLWAACLLCNAQSPYSVYFNHGLCAEQYNISALDRIEVPAWARIPLIGDDTFDAQAAKAQAESEQPPSLSPSGGSSTIHTQITTRNSTSRSSMSDSVGSSAQASVLSHAPRSSASSQPIPPNSAAQTGSTHSTSLPLVAPTRTRGGQCSPEPPSAQHGPGTLDPSSSSTLLSISSSHEHLPNASPVLSPNTATRAKGRSRSLVPVVVVGAVGGTITFIVISAFCCIVLRRRRAPAASTSPPLHPLPISQRTWHDPIDNDNVPKKKLPASSTTTVRPLQGVVPIHWWCIGSCSPNDRLPERGPLNEEHEEVKAEFHSSIEQRQHAMEEAYSLQKLYPVYSMKLYDPDDPSTYPPRLSEIFGYPQ